MTKIISVTGKGGVGKSTFSSLILKYLTQNRKKVVLAVDADSNSTLGEMLGVKVESTIGDVREEMLKEKDNLPAGISKQEYVDYQIQSAVSEEDKFDLITMGRPEGPGCYCYINSILRTFIDNISSKYEYVIIDNEAGMEHLSRRTTLKMDSLFIISEPTLIGIKTADRIRNLAFEMDIKIGNYELVINRAQNGLDAELEKLLTELEFSKYHLLPYDPALEQLLIKNVSILDLPDNSKLYKKILEIGKAL
ncbi:MAG: AAA family ATPase [Thermoplasmata archaeon]|nr:MAG: AAA family ATPase [Thermoplasmata archaeon]